MACLGCLSARASCQSKAVAKLESHVMRFIKSTRLRNANCQCSFCREKVTQVDDADDADESQESVLCGGANLFPVPQKSLVASSAAAAAANPPRVCPSACSLRLCQLLPGAPHATLRRRPNRAPTLNRVACATKADVDGPNLCL